jgi:hypothetical protein
MNHQMKRINHSPVVALFLIFSLLLSVAAGIMLGDKAYAQPAARSNSGSQGRDKVSADLREKVKGAKNGGRVNVIIEPVGSWSDSLNYTVC